MAVNVHTLKPGDLIKTRMAFSLRPFDPQRKIETVGDIHMAKKIIPCPKNSILFLVELLRVPHFENDPAIPFFGKFIFNDQIVLLFLKDYDEDIEKL